MYNILRCQLFLLLFLLFLARRDDQVPEGVSDLFPGLLVGHDGVARRPPFSASAALLECLLLEESGTDLLVQHPDDRLNDVRLVFPCGRVDIPLEIHLDSDSEPSVSDVVISTAVASADNVVWSWFGNDVADVIPKRSIHINVVASHGMHHVAVHIVDVIIRVVAHVIIHVVAHVVDHDVVHVVAHAVVHVVAHVVAHVVVHVVIHVVVHVIKTFEVGAIHNVGGGVDDGRR